jgi:hypothetical protein
MTQEEFNELNLKEGDFVQVLRKCSNNGNGRWILYGFGKCIKIQPERVKINFIGLEGIEYIHLKDNKFCIKKSTTDDLIEKINRFCLK